MAYGLFADCQICLGVQTEVKVKVLQQATINHIVTREPLRLVSHLYIM